MKNNPIHIRAANKGCSVEQLRAQEYERKRKYKIRHREKLLEKKKKWAAQNPKLTRLWRKVRSALRDGIIIKSACVICGRRDVHAHHSDYAEPLNVTWFCGLHHRAWHKLFEAENKHLVEGPLEDALLAEKGE